ncbi:aldo/keto reductase [Oceanobacillus sojae]|uniref:NADP-dependent oxidoreductase domain-containing protein n=1 Tax=Oceanobacillus sojae TaxID=582851 RepID=A0A511ZP22_9BACI|nr:aldo/keto reductase [Oceanobacillus sojae]GEN89185.1 hypothetical protein OSO01_39240 [Oceanobacillus sojae]
MQTPRSKIDPVGKSFFDNIDEADQRIIERVGEIADKYDVTRAQIALVWVLNKEEITSPIIGATKVEQFEDPYMLSI